MDGRLPVDLEFDQGPARAWIKFTSLFEYIPNPEEYFIAPSAMWNADNKRWTVDGYSFVHVSHLPTYEQLKEKMKGVTG